jgi:hypothetical protein
MGKYNGCRTVRHSFEENTTSNPNKTKASRRTSNAIQCDKVLKRSDEEARNGWSEGGEQVRQ